MMPVLDSPNLELDQKCRGEAMFAFAMAWAKLWRANDKIAAAEVENLGLRLFGRYDWSNKVQEAVEKFDYVWYEVPADEKADGYDE